MKRHPILNYRLIMIPGVLVVLLAASTVWAVAMTGGLLMPAC